MNYIGCVAEENWILTEFIEGEKISHVQLKSESDFIDFGIKLTEILKNLHANSIIHFDLKPDHILQQSDGTLRLIDFGLSLLKGETTKN